ncbi:MAG: glycosyltransferase involved in cell wall biosynthesis [Clostridium sp.]|jgi:glycosyltransferase involved in cell wall biosynthesis
MKISLDLEPCCNNRSGIGIYTYNIVKNLAGIKGIEFYGEIFSFLGKNKLDENYKELHIKLNMCKLLSYGIYRRIWSRLPFKYNTILNSHSDIYHFFDYIVPPKIEGKVITTIHDMTYTIYPEMVEEKTMKRIKKGIEYSVKRADKIITVSESSKKDIVEFLGVDEKKIEVVYNGVEYERFSASYTKEQQFTVKNKYSIPEKYILYMGTLEPRKNIESIISAFSKLIVNNNIYSEEIKLVIAGKKGWLYESIFKLVQKLSLENKVVFTDYIEEEDKPLIYNMASIFIFPSIYEGFGIPVIEAMASSVPVITSTTSSLPEVAGDAAILVNPKDIDSMAKAMKQVLEDKDIRQSMIEKGHTQAKKFNWENSAEKLLSIYTDLCNK